MSLIQILCIISFIISVVIASYAIPGVLYVSIKKNLLDMPNDRKRHVGICSRLGGVAFLPAIFLSATLPISMFSLYDHSLLEYITPSFILTLTSAMLIYFVGVTDDIIEVRYYKKFIFQILVSVIIVMSGNYIDNFYGLFGLYYLPIWIGVPFTIFILVFVINAVNLIDGIDGLASGLCSVAFAIFGVLFIMKGDVINAILSVVALGTLLPFFFYNVFGIEGKKYKIFMGDGGALMIGLLLATLAIELFRNNTILDGGKGTSFYVVAAFSPLIIPCFDVVRVVLRRYKEHKPLFLPDNNHIHHKFIALGLSHHVVMILIISISALFTIFNVITSKYLNINIILLIDVFIWTTMHILLTRRIKIRSKR